jgi:hypothetical protein
MKARLLADADLHPGIINGFLARRHAVDFQFARGVIPDRMSDLEVLAVAADLGRVLVSHDRNTMPLHFRAFTRLSRSPGLVLIPQRLTIGAAIEELILVWECQDEDEFVNQILFLPL